LRDGQVSDVSGVAVGDVGAQVVQADEQFRTDLPSISRFFLTKAPTFETMLARCREYEE